MPLFFRRVRMAVAPLPIKGTLQGDCLKVKACIKVTEVQKAINAGAENKLNKLKYYATLNRTAIREPYKFYL